MTREDAVQALIDHVRTVLGTALDAPVRVAAAMAAGKMWTVRAKLPANGEVTLAFDPSGAIALAQIITASQDPTDADISKTVSEVVTQVISAMAASNPTLDVDAVEIGTPELIDWAAGPAREPRAICGMPPPTP